MSGRVGSAIGLISKSGMVENVGIAFGIASPDLAVQKLFPLPVSTYGYVPDILGSRCRPMSCRVDSGISKSSVVENVGVAVEVSFVIVTNCNSQFILR